MIRSTPHYLSNTMGAILWLRASLVFINDVTAERSSGMDSGVHKATLSAQIQSDAGN